MLLHLSIMCRLLLRMNTTVKPVLSLFTSSSCCVGATFLISGTNIFVQKQMHHSVTLSVILCVCGLVKAAVVLPLDQPKLYTDTLSLTHTDCLQGNG